MEVKTSFHDNGLLSSEIVYLGSEKKIHVARHWHDNGVLAEVWRYGENDVPYQVQRWDRDGNQIS